MKRMIAVIILLLAMEISGCGFHQDVTKEREDWANRKDGDIIIGVAGPMGVMSGYLDGITMAIEEVNADGGINNRNVKILKFDDQGLTMKGIHIAQELVGNPKLMAVFGHWNSHVTLPAASIYENAQVLMITAKATSPELTQNDNTHIFRNIPSDEKMGEEMADFALKQGHKRMVIYYADTDYGRSLANSFERSAQSIGVKIVDRDTNFVNEQEFERTMERWKALNFDGVFIADSMPNAGDIILKIREVYPDIPIMGADGLDYPDFIDVLGEAAEGVVIATLFDPEDENPELLQFMNKFRVRYGTEPDVYAVQGYETFKLLADAMKSAKNPSPDQTAKALRAISQWPGLTGTLSVDQNGDVAGKVIREKVVENGKFKYLHITQH